MYSLCIILNMQRKRLNHLLDFSCSKLSSIIFFSLDVPYMVSIMASAAGHWTDSSFSQKRFIGRLVIVSTAIINTGSQKRFVDS